MYKALEQDQKSGLTVDHLCELESYLTGSAAGAPEEKCLRTISLYYNSLPIDGELETFLTEYGESGGTVGVVLPHVPLLEAYRERLGMIALVNERGRSLGDAKVGQTITVARQIEVVEKAISEGNPAIHYESASRLRRELELRKLIAPAGAPQP